MQTGTRKHSLGNPFRLRNKSDITVLYSKGQRTNHYIVSVLSLFEESTTPKMEAVFIASKRIFKKAHQRNKAKRLLREAFRKNKPFHLLKSEHPKRILLAISLTKAGKLDYKTIENSLKECLQKMKPDA